MGSNPVRSAAVLVTAATMIASLAACGSGGNYSACKSALERAAETGGSSSSAQQACKGLSDDQVRKAAREAMRDYINNMLPGLSTGDTGQ